LGKKRDEPAVKDPGPGVHVVVHAEPLRAGRAVAEALGAQVITLPAMAESVIERLASLPSARLVRERLARAEELHASLVGSDPQADRLVVDGAADLEHLADRVVLDDAMADELHRRATELAALEALVRRTHGSSEDGAATDGPAVSAGRRAAAAAVVAEEAAVADARCALALADVLLSTQLASEEAPPGDAPPEPAPLEQAGPGAPPDDTEPPGQVTPTPDPAAVEDDGDEDPAPSELPDGGDLVTAGPQLDVAGTPHRPPDGVDVLDEQPIDDQAIGDGQAIGDDGPAGDPEPTDPSADGPPTQPWPIILLDDAVDDDVAASPSGARGSEPAGTDALLGEAGATDDRSGMWDFDQAETGSGHDGSILTPLGIFLVGLTIACALVLAKFSVAAGAITLAIFLLIAALVRYSITSERRNAAHRLAAREALANAVTQRPERHDPGALKVARPTAAAPPDQADGFAELVDPSPGDGPVVDDDPPLDDQPTTGEVPPPADEPSSLPELETDEQPTDLPDDPTDDDDDEALGPAATLARLDDAERARRAQVLADAVGRLADARDAWAAIAGPEADPAAVEEQITAPEPDDEPDTTPALRATRAVLAQARAAWQETWARLGRSAPPPDDAVVDLLIADLQETAPDPAEAELALSHRPAVLARQTARTALAELLDGDDLEDLRARLPDDDALDDQPLVLIEPFHDLSKRRREGLRAMLDALPADLTVVVIVQSAKHVPAGAARGAG